MFSYLHLSEVITVMRQNTKLNLINSCLVLVLFSVFSACADAPSFDAVPELKFEGLSKQQLAQSINSDTLVIHYYVDDAEGDIGGRVDGDLFLKDLRDSSMLTPYRLPMIDGSATGNGVSLDIYLNLFKVGDDICCKTPAGICRPSIQYPLDTLYFESWLVDLADHESNRVVVGPIYITCD